MIENSERTFEGIPNPCRSTDEKCPQCHGIGYLIVYKETEDSIRVYGPGHPIIYSEECPFCCGQRYRVVKKVKSNSDLPDKYKEVKYTDFKWDIYRNEAGEVEKLDQHKAVVDDLLGNYRHWEQNGMGLYIWSNRKGSGKTMLACCIANHIMGVYGKNVKFVSAPSLLDILSKKDQYDRDPMETFKTHRVLIIDDLGAEQSDNTWFQDSLYKIIDARMNKRLMTIITSNVKLDKLPYDERTVDRIDGICIQLRLPQYSVRNAETRQNRMDFLKERGLIQ